MNLAQTEIGIDWAAFSRARDNLGAGFVRLLGYFREDGAKSVAAIETAIRQGAATPLVLPAHRLKSEAREFGAIELAELAEHIEMHARNCIEWRQEPGDLVEHIVRLRPLYEDTIAALDAAVNPLKQRVSSNSIPAA